MTTLTLETSKEYNARLTALYANVTDDGVYVDNDEDCTEGSDKDQELYEDEMPDYV